MKVKIGVERGRRGKERERESSKQKKELSTEVSRATENLVP